MHLEILKQGHHPLQKLQLKIIKIIVGEIPAPIAIFSYRRNFFGKHFVKLLQKSMRKTKHWTIGEAELIAAFISKKNTCNYCLHDHLAVANNALTEKLILATLDDYQTAPISDQLKTILPFLAKLSLTPTALNQSDITPLRAAGISDAAIEEAITICALFCAINRMIFAFGYPTSSNTDITGKILYRLGYSAASISG